MSKWVYQFGAGRGDGDVGREGLLGSKGASLATMSALGLPVPPGFTISTDVCRYFHANGRTYPDRLDTEVDAGIAWIGSSTGQAFGGLRHPLLLSVRPGARTATPGMLETVLNVGLNDETVRALGDLSGDEQFAWDSYRRLVQTYARVVLGADHEAFEEIVHLAKDKRGVDFETDLSASDWQDVVARFKACLRDDFGESFPDDPSEQLWGAIGAAFRSWTSSRAIAHRTLNDIPDEWGTAVTVQAMVFGNRGEDSAAGIATSRDPSTGEHVLCGRFLANAQGEDVSARIRQPCPVSEREHLPAGPSGRAMESAFPQAFQELRNHSDVLERHHRDVQEIEFTIERGRLWLLQSARPRTTVRAALKVLVDMAEEGLITRKEAVARVETASLDQLLHPTVDPQAEREVVTTGLPASPGAAAGEIAFTSDEAVEIVREGRKALLVRAETTPEDVHGMRVAEGVLTARGGMTSHAAVVARGMGKPCVAGAGSLRIDAKNGNVSVMGRIFRRGDVLTVDGSSGQVLAGRIAMLQPELSGYFGRLLDWADDIRRMRVRSNADTPSDARSARDFGAEGIGLCRTEHMFFEAGRIGAMREMILAETEEGRRAALAQLLPMQRSDFVELFEIMNGLPVTIRLLDPPLHEFLPKTDGEIAEAAASLGLDDELLRQRVAELAEMNPMLGHRGCRLLISHPDIAEMQARAIFEAAGEAADKTGRAVMPEIMVPLVGLRRELEFVKRRIDTVASEVAEQSGKWIDYRVGTMIELPRAALRAGDIAMSAEFFSFGTNDLTQTTFGISRDDAVPFMATYLRRGILDADPFVSLDITGVGELVRLASESGRDSRPDITLGVCGEHGGDPESIRFFEATGLDYISCSPFRVPIARLAAAQAAIAAGG